MHWHSLGIVLARLCVAPNGALADRAWQAATVAYAHYSRVVADTEKGMLWRPVAKLMTRARQARAEAQGRLNERISRGNPGEYTIPPRPVGGNQSYPYNVTTIPNNNATTSTSPGAANLPVDFDMLSFQDPAALDFNNTYPDQFGNMSGFQDDSGMINTDIASWDMFIDDMNADYIGNDDFSEVTVPPMFPIYQKELQPKPSNGAARAYPPYVGAGFR